MTKKRVRRISANIPAIIIEKWEELLKRENGYLPFNFSQRLELAILEHTRLIERRIGDAGPSGGGGAGTGPGQRRREEDDEERHSELGDKPERWHSDQENGRTIPDTWHGYLKTA